jgi:hypothetical protein
MKNQRMTNLGIEGLGRVMTRRMRRSEDEENKEK